MEKEAVADSSSIIFLAKLDIFALVKNVFVRLILPEEVIKELFEKDSRENEIIKKELGGYLTSSQVRKIKDIPLGDGEKAAISYCLENKIKTLLSDDKKSRIYAKTLGIDVIGLLGILFFNLKENRIKKKEFLELLNNLVENGYYISPQLYAELMKKVEELT